MMPLFEKPSREQEIINDFALALRSVFQPFDMGRISIHIVEEIDFNRIGLAIAFEDYPHYSNVTIIERGTDGIGQEAFSGLLEVCRMLHEANRVELDNDHIQLSDN